MKDRSDNPWLNSRTRTGAEYDAPYEARARAGQDIHGEANLVEKLLAQAATGAPQWVLDGGCGTGRTAIELARRGFHIVGVDLDEVMLGRARQKAPGLTWHLADLATIDLGCHFDAVVLAGNVMIYLTPGSEAAVLANLSRHLKPGGFLLAAFELTPYPWTDMTLPRYEKLAAAAGLQLRERWSTWDQDRWQEGDNYVVILHGRTKPA